MAANKSNPQVNIKPYPYENFQGLDASRDETAQDTGRDQHLATLNNAYCDWRGQIVRDDPALLRMSGHPTTHIRFFGKGEAMWAEQDGAGINFKTDRGHSLDGVHPPDSVVTSATFNRLGFFVCSERPMYYYDGFLFSRVQSQTLNEILKPSFAAPIQRRMAVAGIRGKETEVHLCRVDNHEVWPDDELDDEESVLRAGKIDIRNLLSNADEITGLGSFEQNRLIIFTADRAFVYYVDPNINYWALDDNANINIGCVSHNTIANAGTDVLFCSRSGIHSIRRSTENGILVYSQAMSEKVDLIYRSLYNSVPDPRQISAVFDQDEARYHVFFPQAGNQLCTRLTLSLNPEGGEPQPKFSTGDFLQARCGAFLAGTLLLGTPGGVYKALAPEADVADMDVPNPKITTPMLWHGNMQDYKQTHSMTLQASGKGKVVVTGITDTGIVMGSITFEIDDDSDDSLFHDVPLFQQYERMWQHRYRGAKYLIEITEGSGVVRITGFAISVRK